MIKARKKRNAIVIISILSIPLLILFQNAQNSLANGENKDLEIKHLKFKILEFSDDINTAENINSINFNLPSSTWNITDIEMNFTNIEHVREIKTIEDSHNSNNKYLKKNELRGLGVQIKLNENTTIFGVYINIDADDPDLNNDQVYAQIRGYNSQINEPNDTVYRSVALNYTTNAGWYYQEFNSPLTLPKGNYSLVMMADYLQSANTKYYWFYNSSNPKNPDLYRSEFESGNWLNPIKGFPFLYKLDQKISGDFYPEKSNMTAEIGGNTYKISNYNEVGSGLLSLPAICLSPKNSYLNVPIFNNKSSQLIFNLSYHLKIKNQLISNGLVKIDEYEDNIWTINPQIQRYNYNYSIEFDYFNSWGDLKVFKNGEDITSTVDVVDNGDKLYILNNTIGEGDSWEISAKSLKTDFDLEILETKFMVGKELTFFAHAPILEGNFTFILISSFGSEIDRKVVAVASTRTEYSCIIPPTSNPGNWTAYIFWNNISAAGMISQNFTILEANIFNPSSGGGSGGGGSSTENTLIEPLSGLIISLGVIAGAVGSLTTYQTVRKIKKKRDIHMQSLYNKFKDNLSLNYLMISDHKSGLNVYEQFFAGKSIDPSLLSGFLEAIRNFGIELTGAYKPSETVKLEYQNSKILMNERKDFRIIIIMSDDPSEAFKNSITKLADEIEEKYGHLLREFRGGEITQFSNIKELIEKYLNVAFTYPLRIIDTTDMKLTRTEKLMIQKAKSVMKQTNLSYFYSSFLMPDQQYDPEKTKTIFNLIDKGIFKPINLNFKK